jgi:hypothetical protein
MDFINCYYLEVSFRFERVYLPVPIYHHNLKLTVPDVLVVRGSIDQLIDQFLARCGWYFMAIKSVIRRQLGMPRSYGYARSAQVALGPAENT